MLVAIVVESGLCGLSRAGDICEHFVDCFFACFKLQNVCVLVTHRLECLDVAAQELHGRGVVRKCFDACLE